LRRRLPPPPTFALVGTGVIAGLIGAVMNAAIAWEYLGPEWDLAGRRMLTEGMVLMLILGVGAFLGPRLLGFAQMPDLQNINKLIMQNKPPFMTRYGTKLYTAAGIAIILSILLEYGFGFPAGAWIRALVATLLVGLSVQPWKLPVSRTTLSWCVWTAHW